MGSLYLFYFQVHDGLCVRVCVVASCERASLSGDVVTGDFSFSESDLDDYDVTGFQLDDTAHAQNNERRDVAPPGTSTSWPGQRRTAPQQVRAAGATLRLSTAPMRCRCFIVGVAFWSMLSRTSPSLISTH